MTRRDPVLIKALRTAHAMLEADAAGRPTLDAAPASPHLRRLVRLAFLAPDLQRAILAWRQPPGLTLERLMHAPMPMLWSEQAALLDSLGVAVASAAPAPLPADQSASCYREDVPCYGGKIPCYGP